MDTQVQAQTRPTRPRTVHHSMNFLLHTVLPCQSIEMYQTHPVLIILIILIIFKTVLTHHHVMV